MLLNAFCLPAMGMMILYCRATEGHSLRILLDS